MSFILLNLFVILTIVSIQSSALLPEINLINMAIIMEYVTGAKSLHNQNAESLLHVDCLFRFTCVYVIVLYVVTFDETTAYL